MDNQDLQLDLRGWCNGRAGGTIAEEMSFGQLRDDTRVADVLCVVMHPSVELRRCDYDGQADPHAQHETGRGDSASIALA